MQGPAGHSFSPVGLKKCAAQWIGVSNSSKQGMKAGGREEGQEAGRGTVK